MEAVKIRFMEKVKKVPNGCWLWLACRDSFGYGRFWYKNQMIPAHRISYLLHNGDLVDGLSVLHNCNNALCVNPDHLRLGTQADNMRDLAIAGNSPHKKIDVPTAVRMRINGFSLQSIANEFDCSKQAVRAILMRTYGTSNFK